MSALQVVDLGHQVEERPRASALQVVDPGHQLVPVDQLAVEAVDGRVVVAPLLAPLIEHREGRAAVGEAEEAAARVLVGRTPSPCAGASPHELNPGCATWI